MELTKFERKTVKLENLKRDESNPNRMNKQQEAALQESLERFGYVQEIIADKNSLIIADGEHRVAALQKKGVTEAEIKLYPFKDDAERRVFRQVANKLRGQHSEELDAAEFQTILKSLSMEELTSLTAIPEQDIMSILSKALQDENKEAKSIIEQTQQVYTIKVTCPACGHQFEKQQ